MCWFQICHKSQIIWKGEVVDEGLLETVSQEVEQFNLAEAELHS